jgi:hypothetical protein
LRLYVLALRSVELIGRIGALDARPLLVAIRIQRDTAGFYHVCSLYPISNVKVESRRAKGFLKVAVP